MAATVTDGLPTVPLEAIYCDFHSIFCFFHSRKQYPVRTTTPGGQSLDPVERLQLGHCRPQRPSNNRHESLLPCRLLEGYKALAKRSYLSSLRALFHPAKQAMKTFASLIVLALATATSFAAPAPAPEAAPEAVAEVEARQLLCPDVQVYFARGTTEVPTLGAVIGPPFAAALNAALPLKRVSFDGVPYAALVSGYLAGGDPAGALMMANSVRDTISRCPNAKIVISGYRFVVMLVFSIKHANGR